MPVMKKLSRLLAQFRVSEISAPRFVSGICLSIFWSSDGAMAHNPSALIWGVKFPAITNPSAKAIEQAPTPGRPLARDTNSFALFFVSVVAGAALASAAGR